jgi:hypothetical protein
MADAITFERKALYDEVWTDPIAIVAKRYDLPDGALRKICRELAVPTPSQGYWPSLRMGKVKPERTALPAFKGPSTYAYTADAKRLAIQADARRIRQEESAPENRVVPNADGPLKDPLVKAVAKYLDTAVKHLEMRKRPGWRPATSAGWMHVFMTHSGCVDPEHEYLRIIVTPPMRRRAVYIADVFMCAVRAHGFVARPTEKGVEIECKDVVMRIRLTELERQEATADGQSWVALGRLRLSLRRVQYEHGIPDGISITDAPGKPIEEQLNDLIAKLRVLVLGADGREEQRKLSAIEREAHRIKIEAEVRERLRQAEEAKRDADCVDGLFSEADRWSVIERRRHYLDCVERAAQDQGVDLSIGSPLHSWLSWARGVCDKHDPLRARLGSIA